jgi:hypothetical protein
VNEAASSSEAVLSVFPSTPFLPLKPLSGEFLCNDATSSPKTIHRTPLKNLGVFSRVSDGMTREEVEAATRWGEWEK